MSFLKKLFGFGGGSATSGASGSWESGHETVHHEGFAITPAPAKENGQFRLAGTISKEVNGEMCEHRLIRADVFASEDECVDFTIRKAKQVIKEQGDRLFG